ncbi:hypothetical protein FSP39_017966 [Pinctada imbricata]|uniref:IgGFc-binding protein N-terminal domain-containing protein n=1 Tax=Pinctada imbricata TaxID=66713 RepID=A0AA88YK48_PINIB|nr:hypothetical protein FSP39_017966 [Pinctada imbricata]
MNVTLHKQHRRLVGRMIKLDKKFEEIQTLVSTMASDIENNKLLMTPLYNKIDSIEEKLEMLMACRDGNGTDSLQRYAAGTKIGDFIEKQQTSKPKYRTCNSHMGKEYIIMFPRAFWNPKLPQVLISSVDDTTVTFESPHPGINRTVNVTADRGIVVNLPKSIFQQGSTTENKGILLRSTCDISVMGFPISDMEGNDKGDIYNAIPVKNLGKSYLYIGYDHSVMSVVALYDNTHLNITITGWNSPVPLSGTRVKKERYQTGDVIQLTLQRLSTFQLFGDSYLLNIRVDRSYQGYRRQQKMKARVPYLVSTSVPSAVIQMTYIWTSLVFPSQTLIPSLSHFSNFYKFITPTRPVFCHHVAIIILEKFSDGLRFDGVAIRDWTLDIHVLPDERVDYNVIMLKIGPGQHEVFHIDSNVTFGIIIQGMSSNLTYGFPAGLRLSDVCH